MVELMLLASVEQRARLRRAWFERTGEVWPINPLVGDIPLEGVDT